MSIYIALLSRKTLVSGEKPGFRALSKGLIVLLCVEVVRQGVPDHGAVHSDLISPYYSHTRLTALFPGLPGWAVTRKVKPIWILLKQETVSGSGISWAICKSAPRSRQKTTPTPHHSKKFFTGRMPFLPPNQQRQSTEGKPQPDKHHTFTVYTHKMGDHTWPLILVWRRFTPHTPSGVQEPYFDNTTGHAVMHRMVTLS